MPETATSGLDKTAIVVTTFLRDDLLVRCIDSIRKFYPETPIFVGDNGNETDAKRKYLADKRCKYFPLPFDLGVSGVRNETLKLIPPEYEYLMIVEDDVVFTEGGGLEKLREVLAADPAIGLCGMTLILKNGKEQHYEALVHSEDRIHYLRQMLEPEWLKTASGLRYAYYDLVLNVFMMRRQVWIDNPWDEQFKTALEHCDFFLGLQRKTSWRVAYTPDVRFWHMPESPDNYAKYRLRPIGWKLFGKKWGVDYVVSDYNHECPLSYEAMGDGKTVDLKGDNLRAAATVLDNAGVTWWLEAGTCLGAVRDKGFIPHDPDIDIGVHPADLDKWETLRDALVAAGFTLKREWWWKKQIIELAFLRNGVKLDLFFFRDAGELWWHGAFGPNEETGTWDDGSPFLPHTFPAYLFQTFDKVTLAGIECRVPSSAEKYLLMRYGPRWRFTNRAYSFWKDCRAIDPNFFKKRKTVHVGGVFDILHVGHLNLLERAKRIGSHLTVGVLTDEAAAAYKSPPVVSFAERRRIVEGLRCVDQVITQNASDPTADLEALKMRPHYIIHGDDWNKCPGEDYVRANGGKVVYLPYTKGVSSTDLRGRIGAGPALAADAKAAAPDSVAVIVKTFLRDEVMYRNVAAIRRSMPYPYRLYIADDGDMNDRKAAFYDGLAAEGHCVITLPYNSGISRGRNAALKVISEPYVLLLDDDTHIRDKESMRKLRTCLDTDPALGIVAAVLRREGGATYGPDKYAYGLRFEWRGELLARLPATQTSRLAGDAKYHYADQVPNVFLAKRAVFDSVTWDDRIKVEYEHMDFFLALKKTAWRAGVCTDAQAVHLMSTPSAEYLRVRHSAPREYFFRKHGIGNISNQF